MQRNRRKGQRYQTPIVSLEATFYDPVIAEEKYKKRRRQSKYVGMTVQDNKELQDYVVERLKLRWSPETIAGRMREENQPFYASKNAIYRFLYAPVGQPYCKYLKWRKYSRGRPRIGHHVKILIPNKISIHDRPERINDRSEYGHYEGDTIISGKQYHTTVSLATIYERKAMYLDAKKIPNLKPDTNNEALIFMFKKLLGTKSLTLDNGVENARHEKVKAVLGIDTYFCDPYSSWQKGGVENANKLIRRFIPKRSNIEVYSDEDILGFVNALNDMPRKRLGYRTPNEVMREQKILKN
jgi:IS30 family transposase